MNFSLEIPTSFHLSQKNHYTRVSEPFYSTNPTRLARSIENQEFCLRLNNLEFNLSLALREFLVLGENL